MNYSEAIERLYGLAPRGMQLGLEPIRAAAQALGSPHLSLKAIQVAGTNGKGTCATLIATALKTEGQKVGLFTSPHLHRFTERIRIDGAEVNRNTLARTLTRIFHLGDHDPQLQLTFFETATLAALLIFVEERVDVAVLEVGLGGRLDSTSVVPAQMGIITSIGLDHTNILGDTLGQIAGEKAAIARAGCPLIVGPLETQARAAVVQIAKLAGAQPEFLGDDFSVPSFVSPPWPGEHQRHNATLAFEAYRRVSSLEPSQAQTIFARAQRLALWPGRFEWIERDGCRFLLDGAHNAEAIDALVAVLGDQRLSIDLAIFGTAADKPVEKMLSSLRPHVEQLVLTPPPVPRAFAPELFAKNNDATTETMTDALAQCEERCPPGGVILVTGSLFTVAEARRQLLGEQADPPIRL